MEETKGYKNIESEKTTRRTVKIYKFVKAAVHERHEMRASTKTKPNNDKHVGWKE